LRDDDFWFWLLTLGVAVVGGGAAALRWLKIARLIEDTPTSRIRSAAQGYVELAGRGQPLAGTQNLAPLTRRPCIWWRYRISQRTRRSGPKSRETWRTVASGASSLPFLLDDGTGQCIVKPAGAEVVSTESTTWYGDTAWPAAGPGENLQRLRERDYRYVEDRIYEHEQIYALGGFRSVTGTDTDDAAAAAGALLVEWKQDQPALLQRFDSDRNGRISLDEWEEARTAARHAVLDREAEAPEVDVLNVLARPDEQQLFLLAALPPADLARRYRRRAFMAFAGFVAAVFALGWLLQGTFG
jgi:hypothetical protein